MPSGRRILRVQHLEHPGPAGSGLNVLRLDESGIARELTVFVRPLASVGLIAEVVGAYGDSAPTRA